VTEQQRRTTLILDQPALEQVVDEAALAAELRQALAARLAPGEERPRRVRLFPSPKTTSMILAPGLAPGVPAYTVKVHAKNPDCRPAIHGVICLHDLDSGHLLALIASPWLTALRTGVSAAIATDALSRRDASKVAVIGAGTQGRTQLGALAALRWIAALQIVDTYPAAAADFAKFAEARLGIYAKGAETAAAAAQRADILLFATWSREPLLKASDVRPGTHITSLGADEPGKVELPEELLNTALLIVDDPELAGPIVGPSNGSLGDLLRGDHPGRLHDTDITVYSAVGLPLQDAVAAWHAYVRAREAGIGLQVDLN
jgi:ornithine cyclodeaminase/alanine dehydrogenase-like protein (mu-crystallin family)